MKEIEYGYCQCGCGEKTAVATKNHTKRGYVKGEPVTFVKGHFFRGKTGKDTARWNGGRKVKKREYTSYVKIYMPEHSRADGKGYVSEHILIAEKALGFSIGKKAVIHHRDSNGLNNELSNLMVFKNQSEHMKFHRHIKK